MINKGPKGCVCMLKKNFELSCKMTQKYVSDMRKRRKNNIYGYISLLKLKRLK